jgi:hypothetical protein
VHGSYQECIDFLVAMSRLVGFDYTDEARFSYAVISPVHAKPIVVFTWTGTEPTLPSVVLNSHYGTRELSLCVEENIYLQNILFVFV